MRDNYDEVAFQTCTRSPVERRKVKDRRLSLKQEYLDHNPERRVNMIKRRMTEDRRRVSTDIMNTFWTETD